MVVPPPATTGMAPTSRPCSSVRAVVAVTSASTSRVSASRFDDSRPSAAIRASHAPKYKNPPTKVRPRPSMPPDTTYDIWSHWYGVLAAPYQPRMITTMPSGSMIAPAQNSTTCNSA